MEIRESGQMYLENILVLQKQNGVVRAVDVANRTGYSKPSVSRALGILKQEGLLNVEEKSGNILLTEEGRVLAEKVLERHHILMRFLTQLGVSESTADADACKIEHIITDETLECIRTFLEEV